jgi:hypothetical protein
MRRSPYSARARPVIATTDYDVKSISEQRLLGRLGVVDYAALFEISRALRFLLDL